MAAGRLPTRSCRLTTIIRPPLRALLIKLVELLLQQQLELREIIDREQVVQIVEMGRVGDDADLAFGQGDYERLVAA